MANSASRLRIWLAWAVFALTNEPLARPMNRQQSLLLFRLDCDELYSGSGNGFTDRPRIADVVPVGLHLGFDKLGRYQIHRMARLAKFQAQL